MAAELERKDIISDDALMAPMVLNKNFETLLATIIKLKGEVGGNALFAKSATTINEVGTATKKLADNEKELINVQNQLAKAIAKDNEEYAAVKKKVDEVNASVRTRIQLGEQDALTINKQNASVKQLGAALDKNRQSYAKLTSEEARARKEGKNLLKVIQQQDAEFKDLKKSMGQHQDEVGNYSIAMQGLDGTMGGLITRVKMLGQQFLALLANPVVAVLGVLVATFLALKNSAETYYKTTLEGEEALKKEILENDAFWSAYSDRWAHIGKEAASTWSDLKDAWRSVVAFFSSDKLAEDAENRAKKATAASKALAKTNKEHIRDVIDDSKIELSIAELLEKSKNKLRFSDEQRLAALRQANKLISEQAAGDVELAQQDLANERARLEALGKRMKGWESLADLNDQQIEATKLTGEELKKLAELEVAVEHVRTAASEKRKANSKAEAKLVEDIHNDRIAALEVDFEKEIAGKQAILDASIKAIQDEVIQGRKIKEDGDKEIAYLKKQTTDDLIQFQIDGLSKILLSEELTAEERAEIEKRLVKLKIDLNNALYDQIVTLDEVIIKSEKEKFEQVVNIYREFASALTSLFEGITQGRVDGIDAELAALEESTARQIELAGDNDRAKAEIEKNAEVRREQLEEKKRQAQRRQAIAEKAANVIQGAMLTAKAILAALAGGPPPFNLALAAISAAAAGVQTLAIAATPIPAFEVGTKNSPEGLAWVGEKGPELKIEPSGKTSLTPGVPTLDYLKAGTQIIPHKETMRALALSGLGSDALMQREQSHQIDLARSINESSKAIVKAVKASKSGNLFKQGILTYEQKVKEDKSKEHIRRSMLGQ